MTSGNANSNGAPDLAKYGRDSTAMDVVGNCDLRGKYAIITGANRGIGFETAKALASRGCQVIFGCRDMDKAKDAINKVKKQFFSAQCDVIHLDLSSLDSVRQFVEEYMSKYDGRPLHYLVLNAAVFPVQHELTKDGYERAYQTQHLSNFFLVRLLSEKLSTSAPSRIVVVSCSAVGMAPEDEIAKQQFDNDFFSGASMLGTEWLSEAVYAKSKVLNVLFASQLSKDLLTQKISVFIAQPQKVRTNLYEEDTLKHVMTQLSWLGTQSAEQAAATSTMCCVIAGLEKYTGCCFTDCQPINLPKWMQDDELVNRLWKASELAVMRVLTSNQSRDAVSARTNNARRPRLQKMHTEISSSSLTVKSPEIRKSSESALVMAPGSANRRPAQVVAASQSKR